MFRDTAVVIVRMIKKVSNDENETDVDYLGIFSC